MPVRVKRPVGIGICCCVGITGAFVSSLVLGFDSGLRIQEVKEMGRPITVLSIALICLWALTSSEAQELTDDLVLALSFEEGAGNTVRDMSQQGNDGKIEGNPQWVDGPMGKAMYFDGKTYVVVPHIPLDKRDFTVQLWVKSEMIADSVVFSQYELDAGNLSLHFRIQSNGGIRMGYYSNDVDAPAGSMSKNEWYNLTFCFNASDNTRKIYIDGKEVVSDISPSAYLGAKGDTWIGGWERPTKDEHPFYQIYYGAIDEVRVWLRLLDEDEIVNSMDTKMAVDPAGKAATMWGKLKRD